MNLIRDKKGDRLTRGLASGGALSRGTPRRILGVHLPSEPLRNPARRQAPDALGVSGGHVADRDANIKN